MGREVAIPGGVFSEFVLTMGGSDQFTQNIDSL